ncbi:NAD-dependent epimerase/dehydratase family protein [Rathayibacter soli]|uniref:NAD-dependent epimerase/dehydratase family protein n=1 Tax=Rathayibacter soli TaxID=3144168 RepID=UPI0027E4E725|nr:NAD-dependent epimerase/dehydratase family protein [Glaciibacter superstes]
MNPIKHHVVLGATGVVGREATAALRAMGREVVCVSRSGRPSPGNAALAVDLLDSAATRRALHESEVAYLTVGLAYTRKAWRIEWPVILQNTIDACLEHGTHLVYFDNVYPYGRVEQPMTESTPIRPTSKKGQLRALLLQMLDTAANDRGLAFTVGRSADFYGPGAATSVFNAFVIDKVAAGKDPTWMLDTHQPHSMTYTPDIGKALATLGTEPRARGKIWHLPTASALTGDEYMSMASGTPRGHRTMTLTTLRFGAAFNRAAREALELSYQNSAPYIFDSTLFENTFAIRPTPYADGIHTAVEAARLLRQPA